MWVARCSVERMSIVSLFAAWILLATVFGLCINSLEHGAAGSSLHDPWDSYWFTVVSQSGIGYGDFVPHTHLGRVVTSLDIIAGLMLLALVVRKSAESLQFTRQQAKLYRAVGHRKGMNTVMQDLGARLIQRWWLLVLARKRGGRRLELVIKLVRVLHRFRVHLKKLKALEEATLEEELELFEQHTKIRLKQVATGLWEIDDLCRKV